MPKDNTTVYDDGTPDPILQENAAIVEAIKKAYAFIRFTTDGRILDANQAFLDAMGYTLDEIKGQHHRIFMPPDEVNSKAYRDHWAAVGRGEKLVGNYRRLRKDGKPVWIAATYNPMRDRGGTLRGAFKIAIDLTKEKELSEALIGGLQDLALGNLSARVTGSFSGDSAKVQKTFNDTMERLSQVMQGFSNGASTLDQVGSRLATQARTLSAKAESIEARIGSATETARSLVSSVDAVSQAASQSRDAGQEAAERCSHGQDTVSEAVAAMGVVAELTNDIAKITKVIEGFAVQTNLLSINAAVEAARAGDAGRGFSVVATEVRSLADRSAKASKDIAEMIARSKVEVEKGVNHVDAAGKALDDISTAVAGLVDKVGAIGDGAQAQRDDVGRMRETFTQMGAETKELEKNAQANLASSSEVATEVAALSAHAKSFLAPQMR